MHKLRKLKAAFAGLSLITLISIGPITSAQAQDNPEQNRQLAEARAATAKYHDVVAAMEDGFVLLPPGTCHGGANGAVGISYVNIPRFISPEVTELEPEFLNYIPTVNGHIRLVSVAYGDRVLFRDTRPPETPGFRPGVFPWLQPVIPPYLEIVNAPFTVFGEQAIGPLFEGRWIYLITVNLWAPNPLGMFAGGNPRLSCPE